MVITMRLIDALTQDPTARILAVLDSELDDEADWAVEPVDAVVLEESETTDHFVVEAKNVLPDGTAMSCHIDVGLPERISERAFFVRDACLDVRSIFEPDGEIICAVPIDCFGVYDLFYSKVAPEIGIDVLKAGLAASPRKRYIAEDLGYILRDEERFEEASGMFQIAVDEGPSSYFIYGELAGCYDEIGQTDRAQKYHQLFDHRPDGS